MIIKCEACNGSGYCGLKRSGIGAKCGICNGTGNVYIPDDKRSCPKCRGQRSIITTLSPSSVIKRTCEQCLGKGFIDQK